MARKDELAQALDHFLVRGSQCCFGGHLLHVFRLYLCLTPLGHLESWGRNQAVNEKLLSA